MHRWLHVNFDRIIPLTIHLNKKIILEVEGLRHLQSIKLLITRHKFVLIWQKDHIFLLALSEYFKSILLI